MDFGDQESIGTGHPALIPTGPHLKAQQLCRRCLSGQICECFGCPHLMVRAGRSGLVLAARLCLGLDPSLLPVLHVPGSHPLIPWD